MGAKAKQYDEDDLQQLAKLIGEQFSSQLEVFSENIDTLVDVKLKPFYKKLEKLDSVDAKLDLVQKAILDTAKDMRNLDKAVGNVEHKFNDIKDLAISNFRESKNHEKRISRLETKAV